MAALRMRPRFELETALAPPDAEAALARLLDGADARVRGESLGPHLLLRVPDAERHFWSPWLQLHVEPTGDGRARVAGCFSPHPSLFSAIVLGYLALATLAFFAGVWAYAQHLAGAAPTALWALPACALAAALVWSSSRVGQRLAGDQMRALREAVEGAVA